MMRKQPIRYNLIFILILALIIGGIYRRSHHREQQPDSVNCPDTQHTCQLTVNGRSIHLTFLQAPTALHPFTLQVVAPDAHRISASFAMADMDMGNNTYRLLRKNSGIWQASVILPVCMSGSHKWLLTLDIDGKNSIIPFTAR